MNDLSAGHAAAQRLPVTWADAEREQAFGRWLHAIAAKHRLDPSSLRLASADASARRYLRIDAVASDDAAVHSYIVMDSPAAEDSIAAFVHVGGLIRAAELNGPRVLEEDQHLGFLLLDDLGDTPYLAALQDADAGAADALMRDAIAALVQWQLRVDPATLPPYDEALLRRELQLFPDWCVAREFGIAWGEAEQKLWADVSRRLIDSALAQPQVAVHRDWMPRNLMVCERNPGVLDFQDAVRGPISYDIASLLRDAFISWDEERELDWAVRYWQRARRRAAGRPGLRRVLARHRVDGPATPSEDPRHLLPPQAPRRQAALQRGPAALLRLRHARGAPLRAAARAAEAARADVGPGRRRGLHVLTPRPGP